MPLTLDPRYRVPNVQGGQTAQAQGANQSGAGRQAAFAPDNSWQTQFLKDIGAPATQQDITFLTAWNQAEGTSSLAYNNPLNTTQKEPGSYSVNNVGVQGYGTMAEGLQANANVLEQNHPGYAQLLQALRQGNVDPAQMAAMEAQTPWGTGAGIERVLSGWGDKLPPGYNYLTGNAAAGLQQNGPQIVSDAVAAQNIQNQQALNQLMASLDSKFATQESQYQQQLLGISQGQLGVQRGQLARYAQEYPQLHALQQQQNQLSEQGILQQRADVQRQFGLAQREATSNAAASGSLFTAGRRDQHNEAQSEFQSTEAGLGRQAKSLKASEKTEDIQYLEQMSALNDQKKNLDLLALRYGVSANEIKTRLQNTLQQTGLSAMMTEADLAQQLAQTNISMDASINNAVTPTIQNMQGVYAVGGGSQQPAPYPSVSGG